MSKADSTKGERKFASQTWADRLSNKDSSLNEYKEEFRKAAGRQ